MLVAQYGIGLVTLFNRTVVLVPRLWLHLDFGPPVGLAAFPLRKLDLPGGHRLVLVAWQFLHLVACFGDVV